MIDRLDLPRIEAQLKELWRVANGASSREAERAEEAAETIVACLDALTFPERAHLTFHDLMDLWVDDEGLMLIAP